MITVVDPGGTPVPVYNKGDQTVVQVNATGSNKGGAASWTRYSRHTILLATSTSDPGGGDHQGVALPTNADIGDVVEIYNVTSSNLSINVYPGGSDTMNGGSGGMQAIQFNKGLLFRRITATDWRNLSVVD